MDKILIRGGHPLHGKVKISGSKNSSLPILIASLLTSEECNFSNVPRLNDIFTTLKLLDQLGCSHEFFENHVKIRAQSLDAKNEIEAPYD